MRKIISGKDAKERGLASYYFSVNLTAQANATRNFQQNPKQDFYNRTNKRINKRTIAVS